MIWEPLYKIAITNVEVLEACKQFMFKPGVDAFARTNISDMISQLALHHPERRDEALDWYADVIQFYLNSDIEDNIIDSELTALIICDIIDIKGIELLPIIEKLFDKKVVSIDICGDWQEVKKDFKKPRNFDKKRDILSIAERYEQVVTTWAGYKEDQEDYSQLYHDHFLNSTAIPIKADFKVGRNDPCPCGSGKKHKKCCLNN
ncbi:SEC-C domain-containing protein [Tamlana agarivorans]|uniref:SEC-C domain-containing protein n=2 Tax=Pseudotamlana agarivorans TaxID=481183 RepID=A0ACC5UC06_9FLAO|nr:SEC-C domain-containing protein [Tamlana agarivorans]